VDGEGHDEVEIKGNKVEGETKLKKFN